MSQVNDSPNARKAQNIRPEWAEACKRGECTHKRLRNRKGQELPLESGTACAPYAYWKLAKQGHQIFPVHTQKKLPTDSFAHGNPAPASWFAQRQYNGFVGITPGPSGFVVVDLDTGSIDDFRATLKRHEITGFGECPSRTEGRYHCWFRRPEDAETIGNKPWKIGECSGDIRGDNGYVILWELGVIGDFLLRPDSPSDLPDFPGELFGFPTPRSVVEKPAPKVPPVGEHKSFSTGAATHTEKRLRAYCTKPIGDVVAAPEGTRNNTLNAAAFGVFRLIFGHAHELPADFEGEIRRQFREAAKLSGLRVPEITATLESAIKAARKDPVRLEDRPQTGGAKTGPKTKTEGAEDEGGNPQCKIDLSAFDVEKLDTEGSISDVWLDLFPNRIWDEERGSWYLGIISNGHYVIRIRAICLTPDDSNSGSPLKGKSAPKASDRWPVGRARRVVAGIGGDLHVWPFNHHRRI